MHKMNNIPIIMKDGKKQWVDNKIVDDILIEDKNSADRQNGLLKGRVIGYHSRKRADGSVDKVKFLDRSNLVVFGGRTWAIHKLFNYPGSTIDSYMPYWFGAGEGGATTDNPQNPLYPLDHDTDLYSVSVFDPTNATYADFGKKKPLQAGTFFITDNILAMIYTVFIDFNELNGAGTTNLNELAMYLSPTQDPSETTFLMLSHVCFGTRPKTVNDSYEFEWWIYM